LKNYFREEKRREEKRREEKRREEKRREELRRASRRNSSLLSRFGASLVSPSFAFVRTKAKKTHVLLKATLAPSAHEKRLISRIASLFFASGERRLCTGGASEERWKCTL